MNAGELKHRIEVWDTVESTDGDGSFIETKVRDIRAAIIPQTAGLQRQTNAEHVLSRSTHKVLMRFLSGKDITKRMWFMYQGHRFHISFILNPYFQNEKLEIFCEEILLEEQLFIHYVTIKTKKRDTLDAWGKAETFPPERHRCRIEESQEVIVNNYGQEIMSGTIIRLPGLVVIGFDDEFSWTDALGNLRTGTPLKIKPIKDATGLVRVTEVSLA
ncbi:phage head closure protein [Paenibacillus silvisoli]|uniref:phage head closure protein n=1 Tax=Paenibacillus silvisoli TaxID=3110539 RepID=UPI0028049E2F|nr:phage head closure protein [Paenibacillus silvisoli]